MKIALLTLITIIEIFTIKSWFFCNKFAEFFHFSLFDLSLRINEAVHNDSGISPFIVRFFHNKAVGIFFDGFRNFLRYWDILFLINFLSLAGFIGLLLVAFYSFQKKRVRSYTLPVFILVLLLELLEIFLKPNVGYHFKIICLFVPLFLLSLIGWSEYIKENKKTSIWFIIFVCVISIWWLLLFNGNIREYCNI